MHWKLRVLVLMLMLFAASCSETTIEELNCDLNSPGSSLPDEKRHLLPPEATGFLNHDERLAKVAREIPGGWGGTFRVQGQLTIYLVDPSVREAATAALDVLLPLPFGSYAAADIQQGRWSFIQLYDWYHYIQMGMGWPDGVITGDIDEAQNRLRFGVLAENLDSAQAVFEAAELPCGLVELEETSPIVFLQ